MKRSHIARKVHRRSSKLCCLVILHILMAVEQYTPIWTFQVLKNTRETEVANMLGTNASTILVPWNGADGAKIVSKVIAYGSRKQA